MSYLGFTQAFTAYLNTIDKPNILEIGIDRGQTTLPLLANLVGSSTDFCYCACDVRTDPNLVNQLSQITGAKLYRNSDQYRRTANSNTMELNFDREWNLAYLPVNSLSLLPSLAAAGERFDLVLIDGDHNYPTVSKELSYINHITYDSSLVVIDDYSGKWSKKDLYYKDRKSHVDNDLLENIESDANSSGVRAAVDDWLSENPEWSIEKSIEPFEPAFLYKKPNVMSVAYRSNLTLDAGLFVKCPDPHRFKGMVHENMKKGAYLFCRQGVFGSVTREARHNREIVLENNKGL